MTGRGEDHDFPSGFERGNALRDMQAGEMEGRLAADEHRSDPDADVELNDLHAGTGQLCLVCGRPTRPGQATRKTITGAYQHDSC